MKLQEYFDRIEIINLPERIDRRNEIIHELTKIGCPLSDKVRIFPAIRPSTLEGFPSLGARGCFLSHQAVIEQALKDDIQKLLIIEDDLLILKNFHKYNDRIFEELKSSHWNFLYLGHFLTLKSFPPHIQQLNEPLQCAHFFAIDHSTMRPLSQFLASILTRSPGDSRGGPMHVDGAYNTFRKDHPEIITLISNPSLGIQRSSKSDIVADHKWHDKIYFFTKLARFYRMLKNWLLSRF